MAQRGRRVNWTRCEGPRCERPRVNSFPLLAPGAGLASRCAQTNKAEFTGSARSTSRLASSAPPFTGEKGAPNLLVFPGSGTPGFLLAPIAGMVGSDALQAIVYARGSLRLLDQVRLLLRFLSFPSPASWEPGGGDGFLAGFDSFWADFLTRRRGSCRSRWITSTSRTPPMAGEMEILSLLVAPSPRSWLL